MFSLSTHCSVCHNERESMFKVSKKDKQIIKRLKYCGFKTNWLGIDTVIFICDTCCVRLQATYEFMDICRRNSALLKLYFSFLNTKSPRKNTIQCELSEEELQSDSDFVFVVLENEDVEIDQEQLQNLLKEYEKLPKNESMQEKGKINEKKDMISVEPLVEMGNIQEVLINKDKKNENANSKTSNNTEEPEFRNDSAVDSIFLQEKVFTPEGLLILPKETNIVSESSSSGQNVGARTARKKLVQCEVCNKSFHCRAKCAIHMRTHTGEKPFACKFCDKRFTRVENLNDHILTHGQKPFKCSECGETFVFRKNFKKHQISECALNSKKVIACERQFKCVFCKKDFTSHVLLVNHMAEHNEATNNYPNYNDLFMSKLELDEYVAARYAAEEFKCIVCNKEFNTKHVFRRHLLTHCNRSLECTVCTKKFNSEMLLERHKLLHSGEEPYTCSMCAQKFLFKHQLTHHMATHKEKEFACLVCAKIFYSQSTLKRHMQTHTRGKTYKCTVCNKSFSSAAYLKSHQAFHSGEKPHECSICHKRFTFRQGLYNHKLICMSMVQ